MMQLYEVLWKAIETHARKCISYFTKNLEQISCEDRVTEVGLLGNYSPIVKTVGVSWLQQNDQSAFLLTGNEKNDITKWMVLGRIANYLTHWGF